MTNISSYITIDVPATEKVYVDWPEDNSEEYRFISSRIDGIESYHRQLIDDVNINRDVDVTKNKPPLKTVTNFPKQKHGQRRYEDLSKKTRTRDNNSSIPPLDLISQHSSIDIPGAKGAIDIDFRSTSDSMSEEYDECDDNLGVDKDSLDDNQERYEDHNHVFYRTNFPEVMHQDLVINHGEYNSSRYYQNDNNSRRFSEISVPSQYKVSGVPVQPNYPQYEVFNQPERENEQAAFEAVQQRFKHNLTTGTQEPQKERVSANSLSKLQKIKPTMKVSPQIKQTLYEKSPNFIELNKATLNQQKQINQTSYANQFADRQRKDSPKRSQKNPNPSKDVSLQSYNYIERLDRNPTLSAQEYRTKRDRSVERLIGEHKDYKEENQYQVQQYIYAQKNPQVVYAYTQEGEKFIINANEIIVENNNQKTQEIIHNYPTHPIIPEYYSNPNLLSQNQNNSVTSPRSQRYEKSIQEMRRSFESEHNFKDAPFKRQPTLYDEKLLEKKTRIVSTERLVSHLPPLPRSSDSNMNQNNSNGYLSSLRKKDPNYEQYTLRDFRNIKLINTVGGLGPNIGTELHKQKKEKLVRQKNYSKAVKEKNQEVLKKREADAKDKLSVLMKYTSGNTYSETEDYNQKYSNTISVEIDSSQQPIEDKSERPNQKSNFSSANSKSREQVAKRDVMINYGKSVKEMHLKKHISKRKLEEHPSSSLKKENDASKITHNELFNNLDLDRLLQRHEYDKKMTDQLREKWENIP